jgi:DNA-binding FadR family transcriptional regulator
MTPSKAINDTLSDFIRYLAALPDADDRLPPLALISKELGCSVASVREKLEVARALGLVEVKPRTGIRRLPFQFGLAIRQILAYAVSKDAASFQQFYDLRNHVEEAYWHESVRLLTPLDVDALAGLVRRAKLKLSSNPVQIPHQEHRDLHLRIYSRLNNTYVTGILESYWELYEAVGLNMFTDYAYLQRVWNYHEKMVQAIQAGQYDAGYQALVEHIDLLTQRPRPAMPQKFE